MQPDARFVAVDDAKIITGGVIWKIRAGDTFRARHPVVRAQPELFMVKIEPNSETDEA